MSTTAAKENPSVSWQNARQGGLALYSWRRAVGLNRPTFARLARFSERTLATYEGDTPLTAPVQAQVTEAVRLVRALLEILPAAELPAWLGTPNPGFDGRSPWALIEAGERDILWEMIHQTRHGAFA